MQKVIICKGLPASGKSYFAKNLCEKDSSFVRINRDDLRNMRGKYWLPKQEEMITRWQVNLIDTTIAFDKNLNFVLDDTNLNPKVLSMWLNFFKERKIEIEVKDFTDVSLRLCIERDLQRPNSVGEKVIRRMYNQYILGTTKIIQDETLPHAIICDLDGTLCLFGNKSPYDRDFLKDEVNETVFSIINNYYEGINGQFKLFLFSGRNSKYKKETIEWLEKNIFPCNDFNFDKFLIMRKEDDTRDDVIVKKEMFDELIKDKYYIDFVLDDRNRVVDFWRSLGLTCLQVADGSF